MVLQKNVQPCEWTLKLGAYVPQKNHKHYLKKFDLMPHDTSDFQRRGQPNLLNLFGSVNLLCPD